MYQGLGVSKEIYPCLLFAIQQNALIYICNLKNLRIFFSDSFYYFDIL